ncbi:acyl carrier protein, partial [Micromonospora sp. NPDC005215]|uniref:acyl carrier protein n=1 Tax=Micromonospora sp. NPDC005215 TaxID=3157024 RepID=UPI0033B320B3
VAVTLDPATLRDQATTGTLPALLRGLVRTPRRVDPGVTLRLGQLDGEQREEALLHLVREHVAGVLGHESSREVHLDRGFLDLGLDSLTALELRNRLGSATGLRLPATVIFDHPTVRGLTTHLLAELSPALPAPADRVLGDIDQVAASLAALNGDQAGRLAVSRRLRELLTELEGTPGDGVAERLTSATDDDLFDFIDSELGTR